MKHNFNQKGIAHILVLALLLAGIVLGIYLVEQRTHFLPFALEENQWSCSKEESEGECGNRSRDCRDEKDGQACDGKQFAEYISCDDADENGECESYNYKWSECRELSCEGNPKNPVCKNENPNWVYCSKDQADTGLVVNNEGYIQGDICYRKIYKWEGKASFESKEDNCCTTPLTVAADQAECKIDAQNTSPSPDASLPTSSNFPSASLQSGASAALACDEPKAAGSYLNSKVATNLMHYYAIIKGTPEVCVKADLGLDPYLFAHPVDGDDERRLFLCSGSDGLIKWRVVSGGEGSLAQTKEEFSKDINDLPNKENVEKAEKLLNISL